MEQQPSPLQKFVVAGKNRGASDESLVALLSHRGWPPDEIYRALGEYWAEATGLAIPGRAASGETSREAFLFLLAFATLTSWATALGSALFSFVNRWFPDPVELQTSWSAYQRYSVTWQMSTIAVAFPIYLLVTRTIVHESSAPTAPAQSGVRKWLTYLAMLVTAGILIGDLIWFLHALLGGEISIRFILKSLTVSIICGAIFCYYLPSLRSRRSKIQGSQHWHRAFAAASALGVVATFAIGLLLAGTPGVQRQYQADQKRVQALRTIAYAIEAQSRLVKPGERTLPASLNSLIANGRLQQTAIRDPESNKLYDYRALDETRYQLCARFNQPAENDARIVASGFWQHGSGQACFVLDATKPVSY